MIRNDGDVPITDADDMNVPVNLFLTKIGMGEEVDSFLRCRVCGLPVEDDCPYHFPVLEDDVAITTFDPQSTHGPEKLKICASSVNALERVCPTWRLTGSNFMPRKELVEEGYNVVSDSREELQGLIATHVLPLYQKAVMKLEAMVAGNADELYYWDLNNIEDPVTEAHTDAELPEGTD